MKMNIQTYKSTTSKIKTLSYQLTNF